MPDFTIYAISDLKSSIQKFLVIKSQNINVFIWELRHKILALKDKKKAIVDVYKQLQHSNICPDRLVWMKWKEEHRIRQEQRDMEVVALQFWAYRIQAQVNGQIKF